MMRYIRAFFQALAMTLRGETVESTAELQFPRLFAWIREARALTAEVQKTAEASGIDAAAQKKTTIHVDGRIMSMDVVLASVNFHLDNEYPYMLENLTEHSLTAVYASNLNDRYWVASLAEIDNLPAEVKNAISALSKHLDAIPSSTELQNPPT